MPKRTDNTKVKRKVTKGQSNGQQNITVNIEYINLTAGMNSGLWKIVEREQ
jgi:hypothetical protein